MIHSDAEYETCRRRLKRETLDIAVIEQKLRRSLMTKDEAERALSHRRAFIRQMTDEVTLYERLKLGDVEAIPRDQGLGRLLIGLRIALGMTQKNLADALRIPEAQVRREEQSEYTGMSAKAARRIYDTLKALEMKAVSISEAAHFSRDTAAHAAHAAH